jgi:hypothetical protein
MAKGRKTAALGALLGAGALAAGLGGVKLDSASETKGAGRETRLPEYPVVSEEARTAARKRTFETEPSLRGTLRTEDYRPILSGTGLPIKTGGMKKGGMTASRRADGIAQRGKTKGRMV